MSSEVAAPYDATLAPVSRYLPSMLLLWLVYIIHGVDRAALLVVLGPIQKTFSLSDSRLGLLAGMIYALPFACAGIPAGLLADRINRKRLVACLLALWSFCTMLAGTAQHFASLAAARGLVGAAEGGGPPAMLAMLSDIVPTRQRPAVLGFYLTGPIVGISIGSLLAGGIAAHFNWRVALFVAGLPGLLLAVIIAIVLKEPKRGDLAPTEDARPALPGIALQFLFTSVARAALVAALVLSALVTIAILSWLSVFLIRVDHFSIGKVGAVSALVLGVCGGGGSILTGYAVTRFARHTRRLVFPVCGGAMMLSAPVAMAAFLAGSPAVSVVLLCLWSFLSSAYAGPGYTALTAALPAGLRATCIAVVIVLANLLGAGLGPQAVGTISDLLRHTGDGQALRHALMIVSAFSLLPGALFLLAGRAKAAEDARQ